MITRTLNSPTRVLYERAESSSYATDSNGCVICPSTTPEGPTCGKGYDKLLRSPTCNQCAAYYCEKRSDDGGSSTPVGGIVGGIVGGVAALLAAGLLYYFLVWKKKHPSLDEEEEDIIMSDLENGEDKGSFSNESNLDTTNETGNGSQGNLSKESERPVQRRNNSNSNLSNRRLSSYESFTRPQKVGRKQAQIPRHKQVGKRQLKSRNLINNANINYGNGQINSPYIDPNSSNRNSIATTISTTNASNILPIAYIPGVTVRPTKNNTKSIYSYETDSIFSDLNTIENASIIGDIMRANYQDQERSDNDDGEKNTMTAIKAQPRLVNVERIEEEEEEDDYVSGNDNEITEMNETNEYSLISEDKKSSVITTTNHLNNSTLSEITRSGDIDSDDSDVDSDIGEIQRATSIRRNEQQVKQISKEIPLDLIDLGKPGKDNESIMESNGSFVLDVEIDKRESQNSGERSPFEDP
ncbi:hypothetical protein CLIB1444_21S00276 [[Candida] jaroonii]|uniref:Uncharacterized protein n=1 Tax=[Candida] jaroonii TaxID=467808 RepID=A0ACA9YFK0_9ASCO|nr:hypothetical protein CLIB1444_21S00276 [[Candida] jaroonii]